MGKASSKNADLEKALLANARRQSARQPPKRCRRCLRASSDLVKSVRRRTFEAWHPSLLTQDAFFYNRKMAVTISLCDFIIFPCAAILLTQDLVQEEVKLLRCCRLLLVLAVAFLLCEYFVRMWISVEGQRGNQVKSLTDYLVFCVWRRVQWATTPLCMVDLFSLLLAGSINVWHGMLQGSKVLQDLNIILVILFVLALARGKIILIRTRGVFRRRLLPLSTLDGRQYPLHAAVINLDSAKVAELLDIEPLHPPKIGEAVKVEDLAVLPNRWHARWTNGCIFENITPLMCAVEHLRSLYKETKEEDIKQKSDAIYKCVDALMNYGGNPHLRYESDRAWFSPICIVREEVQMLEKVATWRIWKLFDLDKFLFKLKMRKVPGKTRDSILKQYKRMEARIDGRDGCAMAMEFTFVKARFITDWAGIPEWRTRRGPLPRRQEIQRLFNGDKVFKKIRVDLRKRCADNKLIAISHRWLRPDQPDPHCDQLQSIADLLKSDRFRDTEYVFYDFWCLAQEPDRKWYELQEFQLHLSNMYLLYSMTHVVLLLDSTFANRAWNVFEVYQATRDVRLVEGNVVIQLAPKMGEGARYTIQVQPKMAEPGAAERIVENIAIQPLADITKLIRSEAISVANRKDKDIISDQLSFQQQYLQKLLHVEIRPQTIPAVQAFDLQNEIVSSFCCGPTRPRKK